MEKPQTWYVYTYCLPDDTVFYVGKGTGNRINAHESEAADECPCRKCATIREVWASGQAIKKRIVFETLVEQEALAKEEELIREYASEHLTNVHGHDASKDTAHTEPIALQKMVYREDPSGELDCDGMYTLRLVPASTWSIKVSGKQ